MTGTTATVATAKRMHRLLVLSLNAWGLIGRAELIDGAIVQITRLGRTVVVTAQTPNSPFRWLVTIDGRTRPALSVSAVLRQIRAALDPAFHPGRVRTTAQIDRVAD